MLWDVSWSCRPHPISDNGIDIHHQGKIDWDDFSRSLCVDRRQRYLDPEFKIWKESERVGIARGAYLFMTFCSPPEQQADFFIKQVPKEKKSLPLIDVEFNPGCKIAHPM